MVDNIKGSKKRISKIARADAEDNSEFHLTGRSSMGSPLKVNK